MNEKLKSLQDKTKMLLSTYIQEPTRIPKQPKQLTIMLNCGLEIISGIVFGAIVGYYLDKYFKTKWIIGLSIMLGFGAGVLNLYKYMKKIKDI